jgi:3'-phosphoadenosine 5'-phosphosulfate sulfotransferase (PAPS reductase)/FAD synthetase
MNLKLKQQQSLPLEAKIQMTIMRVMQWGDYWDWDVFGGYSGGRDSSVLRHIVEAAGIDFQWVFADTGLEYPEIRNFIKRYYPDTVWVKPSRTFPEVLKTEGYPVVSKRVSHSVRRMNQVPHTAENENTRRLYMTGVKRDGSINKSSKIPDKWMFLVGDDRPFETSDKCCDVFKKEPIEKWAKENGGLKPITAMMAAEGGPRAIKYHQCNMYDAKKPISNPMFFWTQNDVLEYIDRFDVPICELYNNRSIDGIMVEGEQRTGCMFCMFGVHMEKEQNRFQKMKITHPKQHAYCMDKLGMREVLGYIGVDVEPTPEMLTKDLL